MSSTNSRITLAALTLVLSACGGGDTSAASDAEAIPIDSAIVTNPPREPLTEADLDGMSLANLSVELPWTRNLVSRDPGPTAPRSFVESVEVSGHESFDRVLFQLSSDAPFAGYGVRIVEGGSTQTCGDEDQVLGAEGDRLLLVGLAPARAREEGRTGPRLGTSEYGHARFREGGIICENAQTVIWMSTLGEGEQVRVLEFRNPQRLVVDLR